MSCLPSMPEAQRQALAAEIAERDRLRKVANEARAAWIAAKREAVRAAKAVRAFPTYRQICAKYAATPKVVRAARRGWKYRHPADTQASAP